MARRSKKGRPVNGIVLLDKDTGMSSNFALQRVKRLFNARKAGHTGALDPLATGMLPICLGEATKFSQHLLDSDKRYSVTAKLGVRTDTSDSDGEVVATKPLAFTQVRLDDALNQFRGDISQVPTMFSALKYQGQPLYKYAREGITVPREARPVTVYELKFIKLEGDELTLDIHCSKGTYIRTIIDDLGELLGCGAHVIMLRRTHVADYPYERIITLEQLQEIAEQSEPEDENRFNELDKHLLPTATAVARYPEINLPMALLESVMRGQAVKATGLRPEQLVRITLGDAKLFVGVGEMNNKGLLQPKRLVVLS